MIADKDIQRIVRLRFRHDRVMSRLAYFPRPTTNYNHFQIFLKPLFMNQEQVAHENETRQKLPAAAGPAQPHGLKGSSPFLALSSSCLWAEIRRRNARRLCLLVFSRTKTCNILGCDAQPFQMFAAMVHESNKSESRTGAERNPRSTCCPLWTQFGKMLV